jgi:poly-gamma-glutamate synthesis protein (capsule biosynthesis protein)
MALDEILPEDAVMIASVDFSHHLDKTAADFHDEKSIAAIANFDYEGVMTSEIDSPVSIRILLRYLEAREAKKMGWWESADSAELMEDVNYNDVTSYLFAHFAKGEEKEEKLISVLKFGNILAGADAAQTVADTFENMRGAEGNFLRGADLTTISISGDEDCRGALPAADLCGYMEKNNIGVVGITDNSIGRCGASETAALAKCLSQERIDYFGTSIGDGKSYAQEEIKGEKIVFISVTGSSADLKSVAELKKENGHVVADVRWSVGDSSQRQKNIAHALIDSGADAVFGSNLASVLPVEIYHGKAIFYSLGNMIGSLDTEGGASSIAVGAIFRKSGAKYYIFPFQGDDRVSSMMPPEDAAVFCGEYLMGMPEVERCGFELKAE